LDSESESIAFNRSAIRSIPVILRFSSV
jgi:hypothetical protein